MIVGTLDHCEQYYVLGERVKQALEFLKTHDIREMESGRYAIDGTKPVGSRIVKAEVIDAKGNAAPLDLKARYIVALSDYISGGGDGFSMLGDGMRNVIGSGRSN